MVDEKWFEKSLERVESDIRGMQECITKLPEVLERKYITRAEFFPVRALVYGVAGILLGGIFVYLLRVVLVVGR